MQYANDELPTWPDLDMWFEILGYIEENLDTFSIGGDGNMGAALEADLARVAETMGYAVVDAAADAVFGED